MTSSQPAPEGRDGGPARIEPPSAEPMRRPVWRVATPGVCRLVDDPDRLAGILRGRPDATVARLGRGRPV